MSSPSCNKNNLQIDFSFRSWGSENVNCRMLSASQLFHGMGRDEAIINLMHYEGRK